MLSVRRKGSRRQVLRRLVFERRWTVGSCTGPGPENHDDLPATRSPAGNDVPIRPGARCGPPGACNRSDGAGM